MKTMDDLVKEWGHLRFFLAASKINSYFEKSEGWPDFETLNFWYDNDKDMFDLFAAWLVSSVNRDLSMGRDENEH